MSTPSINTNRRYGPVYALFDKESTTRDANLSFKTEVVLHTPVKDITYKDGLIMREMIIDRNYEENIADYIEVRLAIPAGTFIYDIFDYADNLELTVRMQKQHHKKSTIMTSREAIVSEERYKLVYLKDKNSDSNNLKNHAKEDLNQRLPIVLTWQILTRPAEALRVKTTSGNFGNSQVKPDVFMRAVMSTESNSILIEGKPPLEVIDIQKADCRENIKDLTFMSHMRLVEIPDYLQQKSVGVYNSGLGCYIQRYYTAYDKHVTGFWMFSLFDPDKDTRVKADYHVYCPNTSNESSSYPASCFNEGTGTLLLLAQRVSHVDDDKETRVMSHQSGFRVGDAAKMLSEAAFTISKNGPIFSKKKLSTEMIYKLRSDGIQHSTNHGNYANNLHLASDVMKRQSNYMSLLFNNLDHEVIGPGKMASINYYSDAGVKGSTVKRPVTRQGLLIQATFRYTITESNPAVDLKSKYVDMQNVAELRYCIGKIRAEGA